MPNDEDKRKQEAIAKIPKDWITRDQAVAHTMNVLQCSREEAEAVIDEFEEEMPDSFETVHLQ